MVRRTIITSHILLFTRTIVHHRLQIAALRHWLPKREGTSYAERTEKKIVNLDIKDGKKLQIAALRHWLPKREGTSYAGRTAKQLSELLYKQKNKYFILVSKVDKNQQYFCNNKTNDIMENLFVNIMAYLALGAIFFSLGYTWSRVDTLLKDTNNANQAK